jgi:hypothetical protein
MKSLAILLFFALSHSVLRAADAPSIITTGIEALKDKGEADALDIWLKGSPIEGDSTGRTKILNILSSVRSLYGNPTGFELIQSHPLTNSVTRVYGVITYAKGPLFVRWDCFKTDAGWIIPEFLMNTTAEQVMPSDFLFKK